MDWLSRPCIGPFICEIGFNSSFFAKFSNIKLVVVLQSRKQ